MEKRSTNVVQAYNNDSRRRACAYVVDLGRMLVVPFSFAPHLHVLADMDGREGNVSVAADTSPAKGKAKSKSSTGAGAGKVKAKDNFVWEDDEVELLLSCVADFKSQRAAEGVDWKNVKSKYADITDLYRESVSSSEDCATTTKNYKHGQDITKETVASKLKAVRLKYREAVDDGRRSGHGRVVMLFYELCQKIWGGSSSTEQINLGVETGNVHSLEYQTGSTSDTPTPYC